MTSKTARLWVGGRVQDGEAEVEVEVEEHSETLERDNLLSKKPRVKR